LVTSCQKDLIDIKDEKTKETTPQQLAFVMTLSKNRLAGT